MYEEFSAVYDMLTADVDYSARTAYILKLFEKFSKKPTLLLDLACGTGGFSNELAKCGIEVIGVDISPEMLDIARGNSINAGLDVLYLCQDAKKLDLFGTVDGAICCQDSLNHITDPADLAEIFKRVSLFLERDCLFIFDLNTKYKHSRILGNNTFILEDDSLYCVWQNEYSEDENKVSIALDFFKPNEYGLYERSSEFIEERDYSATKIQAMLQDAGLKIEGVFEEMTENAPRDTSERIFYVARKV